MPLPPVSLQELGWTSALDLSIGAAVSPPFHQLISDLLWAKLASPLILGHDGILSFFVGQEHSLLPSGAIRGHGFPYPIQVTLGQGSLFPGLHNGASWSPGLTQALLCLHPIPMPPAPPLAQRSPLSPPGLLLLELEPPGQQRAWGGQPCPLPPGLSVCPPLWDDREMPELMGLSARKPACAGDVIGAAGEGLSSLSLRGLLAGWAAAELPLGGL